MHLSADGGAVTATHQVTQSRRYELCALCNVNVNPVNVLDGLSTTTATQNIQIECLTNNPVGRGTVPDLSRVGPVAGDTGQLLSSASFIDAGQSVVDSQISSAQSVVVAIVTHGLPQGHVGVSYQDPVTSYQIKWP